MMLKMLLLGSWRTELIGSVWGLLEICFTQAAQPHKLPTSQDCRLRRTETPMGLDIFCAARAATRIQRPQAFGMPLQMSELIK